MSILQSFPSARPPANARWLRWLIAIILILNLGSVPVYIYVLEIHSAQLGSIDTQLATLAVRLAHIETAVAARPCAH